MNHITAKTFYKDRTEKGTRFITTKVKLFDPQLRASGWDEENIRRDYYITKGKIIIEGDKIKRGGKKYADYLLFYKGSFPIAVIEAKREFKHPADGISQAKEYAQWLNLPFAYSTNGHGIGYCQVFYANSLKGIIVNGFHGSHLSCNPIKFRYLYTCKDCPCLFSHIYSIPPQFLHLPPYHH